MSTFNYLKLRGAIAQSGKSQGEIAERLGVHHNTISAWATGVTPPRPDKLITLLLVVGWDDDMLKNARLIDWYPPNGNINK